MDSTGLDWTFSLVESDWTENLVDSTGLHWTEIQSSLETLYGDPSNIESSGVQWSPTGKRGGETRPPSQSQAIFINF